MPAIGFTGRLVAAVLAGVVLTAAGTVWLWTLEQRRLVGDAVAGHVGFVLYELKGDLEARLNLGLALADLPLVDPLLLQARGEYPDIRSIAVADDTGVIVFATDAVELGERMAEPVPAGPALATGRSGDELTYGLGLTTAFETHAGAVVARLPAAVVDRRVQDYALTLALGGGAVTGGVALLALVATVALARPTRLAAETLADSLAPDTGPAPTTADPLGLPVSAFGAAVGQRTATLDAAGREVARLDEMA
ncbi:hypothetical protein [Azospirillum halopraeferens]|uniref:hypothetical protein n=1 Tax=Azospirillum halopraeferens TaxID=34010 RepID=UPI000408E257|nr:hypothetical protein [Azospirillum halopraeferens]